MVIQTVYKVFFPVIVLFIVIFLLIHILLGFLLYFARWNVFFSVVNQSWHALKFVIYSSTITANKSKWRKGQKYEDWNFRTLSFNFLGNPPPPRLLHAYKPFKNPVGGFGECSLLKFLDHNSYVCQKT